ncbi:hypothetical protein GCM10010129_76300 [Streptomyces fumigatiscleroticus]|nr:hypothetical protein GCM10010129_76300 [Streptomyces fumigatiscleroticus]
MTMTIVRPHATGSPGYTALLPCAPDCVSSARELVSAVLCAWGINGLTDDGEVIVSELLTNTINHTDCCVAEVAITRPLNDIVRIEVADRSHVTPRRTAPDDCTEGGRGLWLVDALSERWGCQQHSWGKVTWAEMKAPVATYEPAMSRSATARLGGGNTA